MNAFEQSGMIAHPDWRQRAVETWARLTWRKRMTQWLRGDDRRDYASWPPFSYSTFFTRWGNFRPTFGGNLYTLRNGHQIFAETLSQWNLPPTSALSKATPQ